MNIQKNNSIKIGNANKTESEEDEEEKIEIPLVSGPNENIVQSYSSSIKQKNPV